MTAPETDAIEILIRLATDDNSHVEDVGRRATAQLTALRARLEAAERSTPNLSAFFAGLPPLWYHAIMEAIEQTVIVCDRHEDEKVPRAYRIVDYGAILAAAVDAARAAAPDADV